MTYTFGPGEYKTRDGRKAVVFRKLLDPLYEREAPLIGYIENLSGTEVEAFWSPVGRCVGKSESCDLMPPPPPRTTVWVHLYDDPALSAGIAAHVTREPHTFRSGRSIGMVPVELEGDGTRWRLADGAAR